MSTETAQQEQIECCICHDLIPLVGTQEDIDNGKAWPYGNNAWPVVDDGSCCNDCNSTVVMPARFGQSPDGKERYYKYIWLENEALRDLEKEANEEASNNNE